MIEGKFDKSEIEFLRDEMEYNLPNGEPPSIQNMLEPDILKFYNTHSLRDKGLINSDINFALQKGFRFLQPSPFGTPWNPKLRLDHVGLTIPYVGSKTCLFDTVKSILENISLPIRILIDAWLITESTKDTDQGKEKEYRSFYPSHTTCINKQDYIRTAENRISLLDECDDSNIIENLMRSHVLDTFNFVASGVSIYRVLALEIEIYRLPEEGNYTYTKNGKKTRQELDENESSDEEAAYYESLYGELGYQ